MDSNKQLWTVVIAVIVAVGLTIFFMNYANGQADNLADESATSRVAEYGGAVLKTNKGDIEIEFFGELAPLTVVNFTELASIDFYDGTKFHRVISGFMAQAGDPLSKDDTQKSAWGTGGPGYTFKDEIHAENKNAIGTIAMANAGPNTNGSQFFINVADNDFLDGKHTVFGKIISGMDVVNKIMATETDSADRPIEDIVIEDVILK